MTRAHTAPFPTRRRLTRAVILAGILAVPASVATAADELADWSDRVWSAASQGDVMTLERSFESVPEGRVPTHVENFRELAALRKDHLAKALESKLKERQTAYEEMQVALADGDVPTALTSAVAVQTLSDDWARAVEEDEVVQLVAAGTSLARSAETSGDWLLAQEVLYRLRTLYDDQRHFDEYEKFNTSLERVNRRIGLLAQYAPHRLYELRERQAQRLAPEQEFPPFNEAGAEDWKEQLNGITQPMLMAGLRTAAKEHISNAGWRPLLVGGIEALRIFSTTGPLAENFPDLGDETRKAAWMAILDDQMARLNGEERRLDRGDYRQVIGALIKGNRETVRLPEAVLLREFGDGATYELAQRFEDQYTEMIWPERMRRFQQQTEGNFVGVGILIRQDEKRDIVVVNPLEGSPAFRAGVKPEDRVASVDGISTLGWTLNRAVDTITGPRGKEVVLGVRRDGSEDIVEIPIERDTIKIRSVNGWWKTGLDQRGNPEWDWMIDPVSRIGYVRLTSFNEDSFADFLIAVREMRASGPLNGLILDLRHNPGGLLKSAVQFTNLFVPRGEIVSGEDKDGQTAWRQEAIPSRADASLVDLPLVILVNQGSASASEIVAGSLQAHAAALIVGERSFGKGSVQTVHDISDRTALAAVKLTTQYYVLAPEEGANRGRLVHRKPGSTDWGVNPDVKVAMTPSQIEAALRLRQEADQIPEVVGVADGEDGSRPDINELLLEGVDPQIQTALLILKARVMKQAEERVAHRG